MGNKGFEAALAAIEMASLQEKIKTQPGAKNKKQIPGATRNDQTTETRQHSKSKRK